MSFLAVSKSIVDLQKKDRENHMIFNTPPLRTEICNSSDLNSSSVQKNCITSLCSSQILQLITNPLYYNRLMLPLTQILYFTKPLSILSKPLYPENY